MKPWIKKIILLCIILGYQGYLAASNLDGTSSLVYKNQHHVFSNGESARGYVRMNGGFTIKPGTTATLDTVVSVSGSIDLRESGQLQMLTDLVLDSGLTWSSGGSIKGRGNALVLNDTLSIPTSKIIHFSSDSIIEGQGNILDLEEYAQLFVDDNVTVTLRNLVVKNKRNATTSPCIRCASTRSKIALDNVMLSITNDFDFLQGQIYIHNDVIFSGTSAFIYHSPAASFIAPSGTFKFDISTTFSFAPTTTTDHLFQLQDKTSSIYLNGCTLKTTNSGMRLTKGQLIIDNKTTLNSNTGVELSTLSTFTSASFGISTRIINSSRWSPDGKFIIIGGGSSGLTDELRIYSLQASILTTVTSQPYGARVDALDITQDQQYIAFGGSGATAVGGFANTNEFRIYKFNGSTLTAITSQPYGTNINNIAWSFDGQYVAVAGRGATAGGGFANTDKLRIYRFDGVALTAITSRDYGTLGSSIIYYVAWNPNGKFLAVVGKSATATGGFANTNEIRIYSFNGSTLTPVTSQPYGTAGAGDVYACAWSRDGNILALGGAGAISGGGFANTDALRLYSFNGTSLSALTSQPYGTQIDSIAWNPDGRILAVGGNGAASGGGFANTDELRLYKFNGSTLTAVTSKSRGSNINDVFFNPAGSLVMTTGPSATNPSGGFTNTDHLRIYSGNFIQDSNAQTYSRSIVFGNSAIGASANLNVEILGAAHVTIKGIVNDDSV